MSKYDELARAILHNMGGASNISSLTHCVTRLRVLVRDAGKVRNKALECTPGIVTVIRGGEQYMLVIGSHVAEVYDAVCAAGHLQNAAQGEVSEDGVPYATQTPGTKEGVLARLVHRLFGAKRASSAGIRVPEVPPSGSPVYSPAAGTLRALSAIEDPAFSAGALGKGCAIEPSAGEIYAPFDGVVRQIAQTHHAVGLTSDTGLKVLIHVGMNTVELNGKYFDAKVKEGDRVKKGQLLLTFDLPAIQAAGYRLTTPVVITNPDEYAGVQLAASGKVSVGQLLLTAE